MHIFGPRQKTSAKFQKDPVKTVGVASTRYLVSKRFKPKNDCVQTVKKVTQINLRITAKRLARLPTLTNTPEKFQTDPAKTVGGVAFTRFYDG